MLLRGFDLVLLLEFRINSVNANINIFTAFQKGYKTENVLRHRNTGVVAFSINGCFNMSLNILMCGNFTWNKQNVYIFRESH